ncbi:MAG: aldo/keto reductase [Lachnospiraceae bacterium]|nr:aldo/keto reductase [Lachnospiraceae bacterium]
MEQFEMIHKKFGFGCMRLPMLANGEVDLEQVCQMADYFLAHGFNYFDTAHGYLGGKSELALKACLTSRHPRESYILTDKLTGSYFNKEEDIRPFFASQLEACGVEYFDFYLMHAQNAQIFEKFKKCRAYETAFALKEEGKVRHVGISFHDKAEVLDRILTEYPQIEIVQIQFNYLDYESAAVESRKVYEVCEKHDKPVLVMEPVKGGNLVRLPAEAQAILDELHGGSNASYAIRFAAGFPNIRVVLSGMSSLEQMQDNVSFMEDFKPLDEQEQAAVKKVCDVFASKQIIPCTSCRYCVEENSCPKNILIPDIFASYNTKKLFGDWNADFYYGEVLTAKGHSKASECLKCGKCERVCPQHLPIREYLQQAAAEFEH